MKILAIGNSFSSDATRYLHDIAKADNMNLKVVNLYIGGCSLRQHYNNILNDAKAYMMEFNGRNTGFFVSVKEALQSDEWDFVTMQQASRHSVSFDSYFPYIEVLSAYIKKYAPKSKQVIHQTWAYEENTPLLNETMGYKKHEDMFKDLKDAYEKASQLLGEIPIIECGEVFMQANKRKIPHLYRDGFHASLGTGRYLLGGTWYEFFTNKSILNNTFSDFDEEIKDADRLKTLVHSVLKK